MAKPRKRGKPTENRGTNLKEAIVLIPLTYNDGTAVSLEILKGIREQVYLAFDGWTLEGTVTGAYRMRSGEKKVESLQKVSVILEEAQLPDLEALVASWGSMLGQETMLLKVADFEVKFIPPRAARKKP